MTLLPNDHRIKTRKKTLSLTIQHEEGACLDTRVKMKKNSELLSGQGKTLYDILKVRSAKDLSDANAANFITYILLLRSMSTALTNFPQQRMFVPGGRTSNIHMVLIVGQIVIQLRGYDDITSDDLFEYMSNLTVISHSNFRRVLDGAVNLGVMEKSFSSYDRRVKQYRISDFGFNNLVTLFGQSLGSLQQEFELTLISNPSHGLNESCMKIFSISQIFYESLLDEKLASNI